MWSFSYVLWYMYTGMPAPRCQTEEPTCVMCLQEEVMDISLNSIIIIDYHMEYSLSTIMLIIPMMVNVSRQCSLLKRYLGQQTDSNLLSPFLKCWSHHDICVTSVHLPTPLKKIGERRVTLPE